MIGRLIIDDEYWGAVEWSEKGKAWCIEDVEGKCLKHHAHIHGEDKDKAGAVALAEAMIRDGRMPTPEQAELEARAALKKRREQRAKQPSEIKRRQERAERDRLWRLSWDAESQVRQAENDEPLYEAIVDAIDLTDPDLWKSNSFARLRDRLILLLHAEVAGLESDRGFYGKGSRAERLARAQEILALLQDGPPNNAQKHGDDK
jgi:hypothetical protein